MASLKGYIPDADIWKAGLRTAVAGGLAWFVAQFLGLPQGYWSVLTAIIVMQTRLGASLKAAGDRMLGTLAGAAFGFVVALVTPSTPYWTLIGLLFSIGVLGMLAAYRPSFRIAPMTAAILLISAPSHAVALISATHRVIEIVIGCAVGVLVSMVVAPARSDTILRAEARHALALLAQLVGLEVVSRTSQTDDEGIAKVSEEIYASYRKIGTLSQEAQEEHASHMSRGGLDPDRLRHCLRDLRTSVFFLRRVTRLPWPASLGDAMIAPTRAATGAIGAFLRSAGDALTGQVEAPSIDRLEDAFAAFSAAAHATLDHAEPPSSEPGGSGSTMQTSDESATVYVSNLSFALEQVRYSLEKLAECITDSISGPASA